MLFGKQANKEQTLLQSMLGTSLSPTKHMLSQADTHTDTGSFQLSQEGMAQAFGFHKKLLSSQNNNSEDKSSFYSSEGNVVNGGSSIL
jgi:hypothetical protein